MEPIYPITALQKKPAEVKAAAAEGIVRITENGMGAKDVLAHGMVDDSYRIDYVRAHLQWLLRACEVGVSVGGYFIWSLMDMFSWTNGYQKRYGLFHVDFDTQRRTPKASAYWFAQVARTGLLL